LALWGRARRLEAVTAIDIDVSDAHVAPFLRAGTSVALPRARALSGICLRGNAIGRWTRARGVGGRTGVGLTGRSTVRSTVGSSGIAWRRGIGWRRAVGWRRAIGWRSRRAILCIRRLHPNGRSYKAHARLSRYMRRWLVERFFARIQWQRRILIRWEYHAHNFLGFVQLACLVILFKRF
jgi:hypothetical protein